MLKHTSHMDTFLYSFITYVHIYIHACMSTHTNYIFQTYYVYQYKRNINLTYYCKVGWFRRKHDFSLFFFSFWWLSLERLLFVVSGQEIKRRALLSKLNRDHGMLYAYVYILSLNIVRFQHPHPVIKAYPVCIHT